MFKSLKLLRYTDSKIFEKLTDLLIKKLETGEVDDILAVYAITRLAFLNEKNAYNRLNKFIIKLGIPERLEHLQNMSMLLQAWTI